MKHHLNENRPVWTRVSSRFSEQRQSWPALPVSLLTLAIWLYSVTPATAASIVVDNPGDSHVIGKISLREALQRVSAPDDVITFAPDIYVIRLSAVTAG